MQLPESASTPDRRRADIGFALGCRFNARRQVSFPRPGVGGVRTKQCISRGRCIAHHAEAKQVKAGCTAWYSGSVGKNAESSALERPIPQRLATAGGGGWTSRAPRTSVRVVQLAHPQAKVFGSAQGPPNQAVELGAARLSDARLLPA